MVLEQELLNKILLSNCIEMTRVENKTIDSNIQHYPFANQLEDTLLAR